MKYILYSKYRSMLDRFWRYFEFQLNHLGVCFPNMLAHTFMGMVRSCTKRCSPCAGDDHLPMFAWVVGLHESRKQTCHNMSSNCGLWTGFFSLQDHLKMRFLWLEDCLITPLQVLCPWDRVVAKQWVGSILECLWVNCLDTVQVRLGVLLIYFAVLVVDYLQGCHSGPLIVT